MKDKTIIQRALPLDIKYSIIGISYISIFDGGCTCDNCSRLISNIATVKDANGKTYQIGTDCMETLLLNNSLLDNESYINYLHSDKPAIQKAKQLRSKILKGQQKNNTFKAEIYKCTDGKRFGFSYSVFNQFRNHYEPSGFDFTFNIGYLDLTINYIKDLPNITL